LLSRFEFQDGLGDKVNCSESSCGSQINKNRHEDQKQCHYNADRLNQACGSSISSTRRCPSAYLATAFVRVTCAAPGHSQEGVMCFLPSSWPRYMAETLYPRFPRQQARRPKCPRCGGCLQWWHGRWFCSFCRVYC
jgi:hypothetical protein